MGGWWLTAIGALITGISYCLKKYIQRKQLRLPFNLVYYNDSVAYYFRTLVFVLVMRSFVFEWSIIPSEANKPSLLVGDRVIVDKAAYGIRLPITGQPLLPSFKLTPFPYSHDTARNTVSRVIGISGNTAKYYANLVVGYLLTPSSKPKASEIIAFRYPHDPSRNAISRIIGTPGDTIKYCANVIISVNGKEIPHRVEAVVDEESDKKYLIHEYFGQNAYQIYTHATPQESQPVCTVTVPNGCYFVMGDNRTSTDDSRLWGCVPECLILGKVKRIYLSRAKPIILWKPHTWIRWTRLGMRVR